MSEPIILGALAKLVVASYTVMTFFALAMVARAIWTWIRPGARCARCGEPGRVRAAAATVIPTRAVARHVSAHWAAGGLLTGTAASPFRPVPLPVPISRLHQPAQHR